MACLSLTGELINRGKTEGNTSSAEKLNLEGYNYNFCSLSNDDDVVRT